MIFLGMFLELLLYSKLLECSAHINITSNLPQRPSNLPHQRTHYSTSGNLLQSTGDLL